jgi:lactoylglutathione lyase
MRYRFDHVHLYAADLESTAQWYHRVFGARILRSRQSDGRERTDLQLGDLTIYLGDANKLNISLGWQLNEATSSPRYGLDHFGLAVDDVEAAAAELIERGAQISFGPKYLRPGAACLFVQAPDGVTIEVLNRDLALDAQPLEAEPPSGGSADA